MERAGGAAAGQEIQDGSLGGVHQFHEERRGRHLPHRQESECALFLKVCMSSCTTTVLLLFMTGIPNCYSVFLFWKSVGIGSCTTTIYLHDRNTKLLLFFFFFFESLYKLMYYYYYSTWQEYQTATLFFQLLSSYPIVSQTLRKALTKGPPQREEERHHCCGMGFKQGLGHQDLDALVAYPKHMKFTMG